MITKKFGIDFHSEDGAVSGALTVYADQVGVNKDGWAITGEIQKDYYEWVNEFEATHATWGRVWGNFESEVYADSEEGFANFMINHSPQAWDYYDI